MAAASCQWQQNRRDLLTSGMPLASWRSGGGWLNAFKAGSGLGVGMTSWSVCTVLPLGTCEQAQKCEM